jgi:hypothetical protein
VLFQEVQNRFMPEAVGRRTSAAGTQFPESLCLVLPHHLPSSLSLTTSGRHLLMIEAKLRNAQALDALGELRQSLAVYSHLRLSKIQEATGQRALTRANALLQKSKARTDAIADKYRVARAALMKLKDPGEWELHLRELKTEDVRPMTDSKDQTNTAKRKKTDPTSFGHRTLSWIWMTPGVTDDAQNLHDGQHVLKSDFLHY